jgi:HD-GYP domain-containing protein (c-di-GMP phosphodiesterase class II)
VHDARHPVARGRDRSPFSAADRVASIVSAAEGAAEHIRVEAEDRVRDRIAEGERAAEYRMQAAEEEAAEILASARAEAERVVREARERHEEAKTTATSDALAIIADAQRSADLTLESAAQTVARHRQETETYTRELLGEARLTAEEVRTEGLEVVANLRQMGDSLRANAERLLRDVQAVHSQMVARIDRVQARVESAPSDSRRSGADGDGELPEVPEFVLRR